MIPLASLDEQFQDHLLRLEEVAAASADATCLSGQRQWYTPPDSAWSGDPQDIAGMNAAFDRTELNNDHKTVISDPDAGGTLGEGMVLKLQVDYIAALERAFRTRQASAVRCRIHAAARRAGHGTPQGLFRGHVRVWLNKLLAAAITPP